MENNLEIIGNESDVIHYNLNKQYSTVRKVIITNEEIFSSFEDPSIEGVFSKLEQSNSQNYLEVLSECKKSRIFDSSLKAELYKILNETLPKISSSMADIKLKEYNFMNSVSNTKFTVTIRCESFSITKYYLEKAELLTAIRNLLREYVDFKGNMFRTSNIKNFQIEISESEEIAKCITLKKEGPSLILSSIFGFEKNSPINYTCGNEFYVSVGEKFNFYKNFQTTAIVREYNKLVEAKTKEIEKVLTNDELVLINNTTRHINDVIIEMYINRKGALRILNISLAQNSIYQNSENGFVINMSSKNHETINLVSLRDNLTKPENLDETQIPNYLLIRNENEVKDLFLEFEKVNLIDGIILTTNFYSPILDKIGQLKNINVIYYNKQLHKVKDVRIDMNKVLIETPTQIQQSQSATAFSGILNEQRKGLDIEVEKLKRAEMSVQSRQRPAQNNNVAHEDISSLAQGLISSPNASVPTNTKMALNNNSSQGKKSAIGFLADVALNTVAQRGYSEEGERTTQTQAPQRPTSQDVPIRGPGMSQNQPKSFIKMKEPVSQPQMQQQTLSQQSQVQQAVYGGPQVQAQQAMQQTVSAASILDSAAPKKPIVNKERYDSVIAVKILTNPGINSESYFADVNNISEITGGEIFFLTTNPEEMTNASLKYILPITMQTENTSKCHLLINSINEFFLVDEKKEGFEYFVNLSHIDESIKKNYLKSVANKLGRVSLILLKEDISLIEDIVSKVDGVYVRDIESDEDYTFVKDKILTLEKRFLMKNF